MKTIIYNDQNLTQPMDHRLKYSLTSFPYKICNPKKIEDWPLAKWETIWFQHICPNILRSPRRNPQMSITFVSKGETSVPYDWELNTYITPRKTNECPLKINGWKMYFLLK